MLFPSKSSNKEERMAAPWFPKLLPVLFPVVALALVFTATWWNGISLPLINRPHHYYSQDEEIFPQVNSLTSISSQLSFDYYSLPYCKPDEQIQQGMENLGQLLLGMRLHNSPYLFRVNTNESLYLCTSNPLSKQEVDVWRQRTRDLYQVNMVLDGLPVIRFAGWHQFRYRWTGFPLGYIVSTPDATDTNYYVFNHLKFRILLQQSSRFEIVGFEVVPCSVKRDPEAMLKLKMYERISPVHCSYTPYESQLIQEKERVSFTYEVEFVATSNITWSSRWKAYLDESQQQYHWPSKLNSLITILLLAGILLVKIRRIARKSELDIEMQEPTVMGDDAPRLPRFPMLLCAIVGNGIQLAAMAAATVTLAALGLVTPGCEVSVLIAFMVVHLLFGAAAGYTSVWLWKCITGSSDKWKSVTWCALCFFNGIIYCIFTVLNIIHHANGSTGAVSVSVNIILASVWFGISFLLTFLGGFIASRSKSDEPVALNFEISQKQGRSILSCQIPTWILAMVSGIIPFGTILIELFYVLSSIWLHRHYDGYNFLLVAAFPLVIVCGLVSIAVTYKCICMKDTKWWWKAFWASGSAGLYAFLYSINYLVVDLRGLNGAASTALYLGYSLMLAAGFTLSTGAIGILLAFSFVRYLAFVGKIRT